MERHNWLTRRASARKVLYFTSVTETHTAAPPHRRLWVRVLVALTSTTAILTTAALVASAAVLSPIGTRRTAREAALREIQAQVLPGEQIIAQSYASQRRWTDMWRESFGVLVATNRRLLYIGAPPIPLLRPRDDGPMELLVESYPYDAAFTLEPSMLWRGRVHGLILRYPAGEVRFLVDNRNWAEAQKVAIESARARGTISREIEQLDASIRTPAPPAAAYVFHIVQRGETLTGLARKFNTSIDVLRQLNQLTQDEIQIGQRLRVPKVELDSTETP